MNKAKYLLLTLLIFSLVFVVADDDGGDSLFGGGDDSGDSLFGGGDGGGDSLFGGGDGGGDSLFGGGDNSGGIDFGTSADVKVEVDDTISTTGNNTTSTKNASKDASQYEEPAMKFTYRDVPVHPERRIIDFYSPQTVASVETNILPHIEAEEVDGLVIDIVEYHVQLGHMFEMSPNLYVSVGLEYTLYDFNFDINGVENNDVLHAIDIPLGLHVVASDQLMISLEVTPGVHTDFQGTFDGRDLQVYGGMRVTYAINSTLALIAGVYVGPDLARYQVVPFGGLIWKPDPWVNVEMLIPFKAKATFNLDEFPISLLVFYESLYFKQFRLDEDNPLLNLGQDEDNLNYESMRVGLGVRYHLAQGVYFEGILGATIDGELEFNKDDDNDVSLQGGSFFGKVGFSVDMSFFDN